jgi:hypothetical protein
MTEVTPMMTVRQAYPDWVEGYGPWDYRPLLKSLGEVVIQVDDDDYQGDSRVLIRRPEGWGVLVFGWGSCSGCDALQACYTWLHLEQLQQKLLAETHWEADLPTLQAWVATHDWAGDYHGRTEATQRFVQEVAEVEGPA